MRIQTTDKIVFEGTDAKEIVRKMRDTQWGAPVLKREYMEEVKDRLSGMPGSTPIIHDKGADAFLVSLCHNGLIRFVPENEAIVVDDDDVAFADDPDTDADREPAYEPDPRD